MHGGARGCRDRHRPGETGGARPRMRPSRRPPEPVSGLVVGRVPAGPDAAGAAQRRHHRNNQDPASSSPHAAQDGWLHPAGTSGFSLNSGPWCPGSGWVVSAVELQQRPVSRRAGLRARRGAGVSCTQRRGAEGRAGGHLVGGGTFLGTPVARTRRARSEGPSRRATRGLAWVLEWR